jgi:hypothetical protein
MRLNRGTLILLAAAVVIIVGIAILNNNQASAPGTPTATPGTATTALLPVTVDLVRTVEIVNNADGTSTTLNADARGTWRISASNPADRDPDQDYITTQVTNLLALQGENVFEVAESELDNFGLATPANIIRVTADGTLYTLFVGRSNPAGNRFYVALQTSAAAPEAESTPDAEATPDVVPSVATGALTQSLLLTAPPQETVALSGTQTVYLVARGTINTLVGLVAAPPYLPAPTATPTPTATLNPLSEVQIATATAEAIAMQQANATATAQAAEATAEVTAETTPES